MSYKKSLLRSILSKEEEWCKFMGYRNPYLDPFKFHITNSVKTGDRSAYKRYPENSHVYDKLLVAQSQKLHCGKLEDLRGIEKTINYPIFIKPRWGHMSAGSKNCFKIHSASELKKYSNYENMIWSEFIDGREGMTDFILHDGRIVYQLTYIYSEEQNGFSDVWKFVSPDTPTPSNIIQWVNDNIKNHTGFVNVQYRDTKIIEVGLRPARGGAYIIATDNEAIMRNIFNLMEKGFWDETIMRNSRFTPYYAFKCFTRIPILNIWPQSFLDLIIHRLTNMPLYEYYFEPVGNDGMVFIQFMHSDFNSGMKAKKIIEFLFVATQIVFFSIFIASITSFIYKKYSMSSILLLVFFILFLSRFLNPLYSNYNLYKGYRQMIFYNDETNNSEDSEDCM